MSPFQHRRMRLVCRFIGVAAIAASVLHGAPIGTPHASAAPCPDVEVIFARGTTEPPGVGGIGQAFVDALRQRAGDRSVDVYAVNYPASTDFPRAADGVADASTHIRATAANCPDTRMVLGGYSQGAAVIGFVTADAVPPGFTLPAGISGPMPSDVADHLAAVALFGKPTDGFLNAVGAPSIVIGPRYVEKTVDLCAPGDPICSVDGNNNIAHALYGVNGMVNQAADFAAGRL